MIRASAGALPGSTVNSPLFGSAGPVRSVQQAVSRLGMGNILNVVIAAALRNASEHPPTPLMERFWSRASTLALAAGVPTKTHVLNLLHRLVDGKVVGGPPLDTPQALILRREPKANVERYDGLRAQIAGGRHAS